MRAILVVLAVIAARGSAQENPPYFFYHDRAFGSDANFNPLSMIINSGFGVLQYPDRPRTILKLQYANGFTNVMRNLGHPFASISHYGWRNFIGNEVIPMDINKKNAQYWPNYQNHLIGGGMEYVLASEWYRYHEYPCPKVLGLGTMIVYHVLNEVVENDGYVGDNVDPIADLCIFDPLGILLFSIDGVPEFFSGTLNMAEWSGQVDFNPWTGTIENHGVNYAIKYRLPFSERVSLFYYWGLTGLLGASWKSDEETSFSLGAGLRAKELIPSGDQSGGRKLTADLTWNVGVFIDRENSLLASVLFAGISDYKVHINVYPGIVNVAGFTPGLFCAFGDQGKVVAGINVTFLPFGIAAGRSE